MKWLLIEISGWIGIAAAVLFPAMWLNGYLWEWGM